MGYLSIDNLYTNNRVLLNHGPEIFELEKLDGTSAHISWSRKELKFFGGCVNHVTFKSLFNEEKLLKNFNDRFGAVPAIIYGEAYGGKVQKMSATYGSLTRFCAFDVKEGDIWRDVPSAHKLCLDFDLDFVAWNKIAATVEACNAARDLPSRQAIKLGMGEHIAEGVILRPLVEAMDRGKRVIAKHKRQEFMEHKTPREVDPSKLKKISDARLIADDWVVERRLMHVMDKMNPPALNPKDTPRVISAMRDDIKKEGGLEIEWSDEVDRAIGQTTARLFKNYIMKVDNEVVRVSETSDHV